MKTATATIGEGIYTAVDVSRILKIPYSKVKYWFQYHVKYKLFDTIGYRYYFPIKDTIAVNFLTLIEMYVFYTLKEKKIKTSEIILSHKNMSKFLNTPYPFAMDHVFVMGRDISFGNIDSLISATNLSRIIPQVAKLFAEKITFSDERMATKFYPLGIDKSIVVNPKNQFGHPIIDGTNILVDTIYDYYLGGNDKAFIAELFDISINNVKDAIQFCKAA